MIVYKRWKTLRSQGLELRKAMDLSFPFRIMAFGLYTIIALRSVGSPYSCQYSWQAAEHSLSLLSIKSPSSPVPDLVIACGGFSPSFSMLLQVDCDKAATLVILIFGTQKVKTFYLFYLLHMTQACTLGYT